MTSQVYILVLTHLQIQFKVYGLHIARDKVTDAHPVLFFLGWFGARIGYGCARRSMLELGAG
jgi:hypothetical protein